MESLLSNQLLVTLFLSFICCISFYHLSQAQLLPIVDKDGNNPSTIFNYIVHVRRPQYARHLSSQQLRAWHESFLPNKTLDSGEPRLLYSYQRVISGFAARLTTDEVQAMEAKNGFILAQREHMYELQTTYTPEFLGLSQWGTGAWYNNTFYGEGIIIGVLDSGIPTNHPSFGDNNMPPPPTKWKGSCTASSQITCNRKIIGAVGYYSGGSAVDSEGHGTHVASIAAGNFVDGANVLDMAPGTASGMAPQAHLAIYKVCENNTCSTTGITAAMDQAILDGVDVVNLSIGLDRSSKGNSRFSQSAVAIACMGALRNGIVPVVSAGNEGPYSSTLANEAPWELVIGATSTDRRIRAIVKLGDGTELYGESAFQPSSFDSSIMLPIVSPGENGSSEALLCKNGSLTDIDVRGKIVLCAVGEVQGIDKGKEVFNNGGAAMIITNNFAQGYTTFAEAHWIPASHLSYDDSNTVTSYYELAKKSRTRATATIIFNGTVFGHRPAPAVTFFSSRGPSFINGGILKPDVVAPGLNILAAWHEEVGPNPTGTLTKTFNFLSGTSMAAPHVSGISALIKNKQPSWPPSFIQSAIITAARNVDLDGHEIFDAIFNERASINLVGAGLVNASNALDPGLVYAINPDDYIGYVCGLGSYTDSEASAIFGGQTITCSSVHHILASELNYPSIMVAMLTNSQPVTIERTVANVGEAMSTYQARITEPFGLSVYLSTYQLKFSRVNQEITFTITFKVSSGPGKRKETHGKLEWVSSKHVVISPIAIRWI